MSLVAHKYNPSEISEAELEATFAARGHTVDYLVQMLRDQVQSGTLSSFVVTGPRGAGKSTVLRMVALRINQDAALRAAWLPVQFPEEQFNLTSLRDLLAGILRVLAGQALPVASRWLEKVEAEPDDEQSQQLAATGLREITRTLKRRLVLFLENLNLLFEDGLTDQEQGAFRRLLMTDPFMMVVGSAVHVFESLRSYDAAFFNYLGEVRLDRLSAEQVFDLLALRAKYDGNEGFLREFRQSQPKVRAIAHLSGGNPRLILMLYELLSQRPITSLVQPLRHLADELTPQLKDELERLPPQQRKILHALMERGGTAQPADLVAPTRLKLNTITEQLRRLRQAQVLAVLGGGKGRPAFYTVPDPFFGIWYQMRYLPQNCRRLERFVEVLRAWFEASEWLEPSHWPQPMPDTGSPAMLRETPTTAGTRSAEPPSSLGAAVSHSARTAAAQEGGQCVLEMDQADTEAGMIAAAGLFELCWLGGRKEDAAHALARLKRRLGSRGDGDKAEKIVRLLSGLAKPALREAWPQAWRLLASAQPPAVEEALRVLKPVAQVLEGTDIGILNALTPETREFAQKILAQFKVQSGYPSEPPAPPSAAARPLGAGKQTSIMSLR